MPLFETSFDAFIFHTLQNCHMLEVHPTTQNWIHDAFYLQGRYKSHLITRLFDLGTALRLFLKYKRRNYTSLAHVWVLYP